MGSWYRSWNKKSKYVVNHEVENMDHILEGVLASNHPDPIKRHLIEKIAEKGRDQQPAHDIHAVLGLSINWILQGNSEFQVSSGFKLFDSWAQHHLTALDSVLTRDLLVNLLTKPSRNQANLPLLLSLVLQFLQNHGDNGCSKLFQQHLKIIEAKAPVFVQSSSSDVKAVRNYLHLLLDFRDSLPKTDLASRLALPLMHVLASCQIPNEERQVGQFLKDVAYITDFLQQMWQQSTTSINTLLDCLRELFNIISASQGPEPSVCLASLVRLIPTEVVEGAVKSVVADSLISNDSLEAALRRMLDWLVWPSCKHLDQWILCFLKELAYAKKFSILIQVIQDRVEQVLDKMRFVPARQASFNILKHMLLAFQLSPQPFHKIVPLMKEILVLLQSEGEEGDEWHTKLAHLLHCLMYMHTGFPDLYDPILDLIKDVPCPSSEDINARLAESRWSTHQVGGPSAEHNAVEKRSDTGKTGLFNLGNTCYMNSVVQTLFMCDGFRRRVLSYSPYPDEAIMDKLRHVFALLLGSERPAVAPMTFMEVSKPDYFIKGQQQDCHEFLRFLLDRLDVQQLEARKNAAQVTAVCDSTPQGQISTGTVTPHSSQTPAFTSPGMPVNPTPSAAGTANAEESTLVSSVYRVMVRYHRRCLVCNHQSTRDDNSWDLMLPFPKAERSDESDKTTSSSNTNTSMLAGGGAHLPSASATTKPITVSMEPNKQSSMSSAVSASTTSDEDKPVHLNELLAHFLSTQQLKGDNKYHCERCNKLQDGEEKISIVSSPQYLILHLLRFEQDLANNRWKKMFREVTCPRTLAVPLQNDSAVNTSSATKRRKKLLNHLHPKLPASVSTDPENCELYGLCSVIIHSGATPECGHYYCFSRHSQVGDVDAVIESLEKAGGNVSTSGASSKTCGNGVCPPGSDLDFLEDKWCLFNDTRISHATYSSFSSMSRRFPKDTPYVLVYRKLSLDDPAERAASPELPLGQELREYISKDHAQYLKEQELEATRKASRSRSASTSSTTFDHWHDFDSDQGGPPGSCGGGGGLGGMDTCGSKFVF